MQLQLYGRDSSYSIPNYSIVGGLLFDLVAQTPNRELSPWEKLYVVKSTRTHVHTGYLADIYMACGCFSEAKTTYLKPEHPRKLGDICWCEGKMEEAEVYYRQHKSEAQPYRNGPDDDRLIKLAFYQSKWACVIECFVNASFGRWTIPGDIILGSSVIRAQPYIDMLALAVCRLNSETPSRVFTKLDAFFDINPKKWSQLLQNPTYKDGKTIVKLQARCRPRLGAAKAVSLNQAVHEGNTPRARHVLDYINHADNQLELAQKALEQFGKTGAENRLQEFIGYVTGSGITSVSHSFLFAALGHDSFPGDDSIPAERLVRLFSCHSVMDKRHLGKVLDLRFKHHLPVTSANILTGIFQMLRQSCMPNGNGHSLSQKRRILDVPRLASCQEWAKIRLEEWLGSRGAGSVEKVADTWRSSSAQPAPHPFYTGVVGTPDSPRNMVEWNQLMIEALNWLETRWQREIGSSPWVAENQLYQILHRLLKGMEVVQHARPLWLEPQHLDVYLPKCGVAVEYMGQQHYEPLEFFGGAAAFKLLTERDQRKASQCKEHGIHLFRVRFDEDLGSRAREIVAHVLSSCSRT